MLWINGFWLYRLGEKALPALHRLMPFPHVLVGKETALVVYRYDYYFVLLEEREMNVTTLR